MHRNKYTHLQLHMRTWASDVLSLFLSICEFLSDTTQQTQFLNIKINVLSVSGYAQSQKKEDQNLHAFQYRTQIKFISPTNCDLFPPSAPRPWEENTVSTFSRTGSDPVPEPVPAGGPHCVRTPLPPHHPPQTGDMLQDETLKHCLDTRTREKQQSFNTKQQRLWWRNGPKRAEEREQQLHCTTHVRPTNDRDIFHSSPQSYTSVHVRQETLPCRVQLDVIMMFVWRKHKAESRVK